MYERASNTQRLCTIARQNCDNDCSGTHVIRPPRHAAPAAAHDVVGGQSSLQGEECVRGLGCDQSPQEKSTEIKFRGVKVIKQGALDAVGAHLKLQRCARTQAELLYCFD